MGRGFVVFFALGDFRSEEEGVFVLLEGFEWVLSGRVFPQISEGGLELWRGSQPSIDDWSGVVVAKGVCICDGYGKVV